MTYICIYRRNAILKQLTIKSISFVFIVAVLFIYFLFHFDFVDAIVAKTQNQGSSFRFGFWSAFIDRQLELFPDLRFFLGHGYKNTNSTFYEIWRDHPGKHVHNNFMFIWYNYGFISMVLFVVLLIKIFVANLKILDKLWFIYFIPLGYMSVTFFESILARHSFRFEVILFFLFLLIPYNMYFKNRLNRI